MTEQEKAGNILLAKFMGYHCLEYTNAQYPNGWPHIMGSGHGGYEPLRFHTSLDWLWPVWVKFRNGVTFRDYEQCDEHTAYCDKVWKAFDQGSITDTFNALVSAVEWYNTINK